MNHEDLTQAIMRVVKEAIANAAEAATEEARQMAEVTAKKIMAEIDEDDIADLEPGDIDVFAQNVSSSITDHQIVGAFSANLYFDEDLIQSVKDLITEAVENAKAENE
jgi:hypothetical protein